MAQWRPPWTPQQSYRFDGTLNDRDEPHQHLSFFVLAGTGGATITGGWGQQVSIARPRRKAFTYTAGFDALAMDVPVRFEATVDYGPFGWSPDQLEENIRILEWMAGRGGKYANGTHPAQGQTPIVQVNSFAAGSSTPTNLIPPNCQGVSWVVSNIAYDTQPIRGPGGFRRRQDATVSLLEYVAVPGAPAGPHERQKGRGNVSGFRSYPTTSALDTIAKICRAHGINNARDWQEVVRFNQSRLKIRSYHQHMRPGRQVHIPNSVFAR